MTSLLPPPGIRMHPVFAAIAVDRLLYNRQRMGTHMNSAGDPGLYRKSLTLSFLHFQFSGIYLTYHLFKIRIINI